MREKFDAALRKYVVLTLACIPVLLVVRLWEYFSLGQVTELPAGAFWMEMLGFVFDIPAFLLFSLVLLVPFLLISLYKRSVAIAVFIVLVILVFLFHLLILNYFIISLTPLDQVVFSYNLKEMMMISKSSVNIGFITFLPFIAVILLILLFQFLFRNLVIRKWGVIGICLAMLLSPVILVLLLPGINSFKSNFEFYISTNKTYYFTSKCLEYKWRFDGKKDVIAGFPSNPANNKEILAYQQNNPRFKYFGTSYPLLHEEDTKDVLSSFFNFSGKKPNLVFIIIESLSPSFFNEDPYFGNFMPFLDSLSGKGLYWPNFLATSDRTFNVLPAIFGSLPWSNGAFLDPLVEPMYHMSMIKYLHLNGYRTSFFYGGNPDFNSMRYFIKREQGDYVQGSFGKNYQPLRLNQTGYSWGYPDRDVFNRSFEIIDSMKYTPRLDIYLTLSMHAPFTVPGQDEYRKKLDERIKQLNLSSAQVREISKHRDIFSTIMYTDEALREFFSNYKKRADYGNTVFIITGDHSMPELNPGNISAIERFHVPFIIFSPMLKAPHRFNAVSTHLDITPSVLSAMKSSFQISIDPVSHWLGAEIDTASSFRNTKTMAFVLNNKDMVDYVKGNEYVLRDWYFEILPGLKLSVKNDDARAQTLKNELSDYIHVTTGTAMANKVYPGMYYYGKNLVNEFVLIHDDISFNGEPGRNEYFGILRKMRLGKNYNHLAFDFTFSLKTDVSDPGKLPLLVIEIYDENDNMIWWRSNDIIHKIYKKDSSGKPVKVSLSAEIDLSYFNNVANNSMKMYLWNPNKILIGYDSLSRLITGYY